MRRIAGLAGLVGVLSIAPAWAQSPITLPGVRAFPESVAAAKDGTLYVGSFAEGGLVRVRPGGKPETFVKPGADGTRSTFGVLVDDVGGKVWTCSNDVSRLGIAGPSTVEGAWLKGFALSDGKLEVSARLPGPQALCNDIAIGPDGAAYVTNSLAPVVLRLKPDSDVLETWATDPRWEPPKGSGAGLDGIAFDKAGNVVVDLFNKAELYRIDVQGGHPAGVRKLAPSKRLKLTDAIRPAGDGSFLLIEGAGSLDRLTVDGDKATIAVLKDGFEGPTGVSRAGDTAWVSEGRLSQLHDAEIKQPFRLVPVLLSGTPAP